jgi:hypothetical protein
VAIVAVEEPWPDVATGPPGPASITTTPSSVSIARLLPCVGMRWTPGASVRLGSVVRRIALSAVSSGGAVFVMISVLQDGRSVHVSSFIVAGQVHARESARPYFQSWPARLLVRAEASVRSPGELGLAPLKRLLDQGLQATRKPRLSVELSGVLPLRADTR